MVKLNYQYDNCTLDIYYNREPEEFVDVYQKEIKNIIIHIDEFNPNDKFVTDIANELITTIAIETGHCFLPTNPVTTHVEIILGDKMVRENNVIYDSRLNKGDFNNWLDEYYLVFHLSRPE
jgi:hypothetical protein